MIQEERVFRRFWLILLVLAALACATLDRISQPHISGAWKGTYDNTPVVMDFDTSGDARVYFGNDLAQGIYEVDLTVEPHHLDLNFEDGTTIKTIFEFQDRNTMRLENNAPGEPRPGAFTEDSIELSK